MTGNYRHYHLMPDGELEMKPAATNGDCIAYIIQHGTQDVLCVMEGGAFHSFDISPAGLARLADEATSRLRTLIMNAP